MSLHLVSLAACAPVPWRNGGGTTRELLRWPAALPADSGGGGGSGVGDDWLVRVSVAEIARDGPFSPYPGIDRWFAVLEGAGVTLELPEGARPRRAGDEPIAFAGEAAPGCTLVSGATLDLNLMVRRGGSAAPRRSSAGSAGTSMRLARSGSSQRSRHPWRALYAHAPCRLLADGDWHELPAGTLAWSDTNRAETWERAGEGEAATPALAFWLSFEP